MPILDIDPGQSPEAPGTLYFYEQGADPGTGFQVTTRGQIIATVAAAFTGATAGTTALVAKVTGDTFNRFELYADGTMKWGSGSLATDFTLDRYAAGGIEVNGALRFTNGQLLFGPAGDVNLYWGGAGQLKTDDFLIASGGAQSNAEFTAYTGAARALIAGTVGGGLSIAEGANARMGRSTLVGGTVVVSNTSVTAASEIFLTCQTPGGTPGFLRVSARTAATSFTILSSSGTDTSVVGWLIVEPV
jgi:hypothetical protein